MTGSWHESFSGSFQRASFYDDALSDERQSFREIARTYAKQEVESELNITLPLVVFNVSNAEAGDEENDHAHTRKPIPSMPSISMISGLSSFRRLRKRLEKKVRTAGHLLRKIPPSSLFRHHSPTAMSLMSIDDLSFAIETMSVDSWSPLFRDTPSLRRQA